MIAFTSQNRCLFCVDGFQPAGFHPVLGAIFLLCLACDPACPSCNGNAMFPAYGLFAGRRLHDALAQVGLSAVACDLCGGITAIAPINREVQQ